MFFWGLTMASCAPLHFFPEVADYPTALTKLKPGDPRGQVDHVYLISGIKTNPIGRRLLKSRVAELPPKNELIRP